MYVGLYHCLIEFYKRCAHVFALALSLILLVASQGGKLMHREGKEPVVTDDQRKLMATQDKKYVTFRLAKELKVVTIQLN